MTSSTPDDLADLARRLARLAPDRRDPERYFMEKSEIIAALRRIAKLGIINADHAGITK